MKILLKNSIRSLGKAGEVVTVKNGYARNYLLPKGFAIPASQGNVNLIEKFKARRAEEEAQLLQSYQEAAGKINELETIVLHMKANASNHLYGSVSAGEVVTQLNNRHINIEKDMVQLESPIKELGQYDVSIQLTGDVKATLKIEIRDEHGDIPVLEGSLETEQESEAEDQAAEDEGDTPPVVDEAATPA